jgi:hypothetical protein
VPPAARNIGTAGGVYLCPTMRFFPCLLLAPALAAATLQETWQTGYTGVDATGPHVLGCWSFDAGAELQDRSGKGNHLTLNGAVTVAEGRFGGALESFEGLPVADRPHQARVTAAGRLSPAGAFTLEMWVQPKAEFDKGERCYLVDKKYVPDNHSDYAWQFTPADKAGLRRMQVALGFGSHSEWFYSEPLRLPAGEWHHLAFSYDAAGTVTFYLDGSTHSRVTKPGLGAVVRGKRGLFLGDRGGSSYSGFPGRIDEVRLCEGVLRFEPVDLAVEATRTVWQRLERDAAVSILCTNLCREPLKGAQLQVEFGGTTETFPLPDLASGVVHPVRYVVDTTLKPGSYSLRAALQAGGATSELTREFRLVARTPEGRMPVIMWGANAGEIPRLKDIGFTHFIGLGAQLGEVWAQRKPVPPGDAEFIARQRANLDEALAAGLSVVASISPARLFENRPNFHRIDRDGKPFARPTICASLPDFPPFFENAGCSLAQTYGRHPAFTTVLVNTEKRDGTRPSFNPVDVANYRAFAGTDIPAEVSLRTGVDWKKLADFPEDRVVDDDHPILKYYRWFWTIGDGWNALHTALHKGVKSAGGRQWTFFDPAVRQPSISGAGGEVDVLSHWTYTYPDPQRIGLATDQLFAMSEASGRGQKVMKMTQLIWYRSQTAPIGKTAPENPVAWEDHDPDAAYITIAPMHLREAFWTKIARPVQGIMYHGWQSLVPTINSSSGYRYTHSDTQHVLRELLHEVVEPLGPALLKIGDERREIAFLESFTSQVFARRGGHGYNATWSADFWLALQHAQVPVDVMFEETLLKDGLNGRKLLVMPECEVLSRSVVEKIRAWQAQGGRIVADELLCPALKADVVVSSFRRIKKAAEDKAKVLELAATLVKRLPELGVSPVVRADSPEVILRTRRAGDSRYVFAINDRREAGSYVGQHGLVMENGLPTATTLRLARNGVQVYDLTRSRRIDLQQADGGVNWKCELGPCDGRIYLVTPNPLEQLRLEAPARARAGQRVEVTLHLTTTGAAPFSGVVPVEVRIRDAGGRAAEGDGFYALENGRLSLSLDLAPNETPGTWEIRARELASGLETAGWLRVEGGLGGD